MVKKLYKKVLTALCALVMCVLCLTGCSWLQIDSEKYYNQVVVTIDKKDFNKKDLLDAFSNYGYQYYQSYGLSLKESIAETIDSMIDRYLLLEEVKSSGTVTIDDDEKLEIKQQVFDYMQDSIFTFEEKIRKEWELTVEVGEGEEEASPLRTAKTEYAQSTTYEIVEVGGVNVGKVSRVEEDKEQVVVYSTTTLDSHFSKSNQIITDKKVSDEAFTRYVKSLQDTAKSEGRSTKEADVLLYEENRLVELMTNNKYLEKYEDNFFANLPVNTDAVLQYFKDKYKAQKELYLADESQYHTAMKEASSKFVYFHPNSGNEYVNVKHILINFSEPQKDAITALNSEYGVTNDGSDEDEERKTKTYKDRLDSIIKQTKTKVELDGKTVTMTSDEVYNYVQTYVTGATLLQKSKKFDELIYVFNDDPGIMNSEFDYVVNLDTNVEDQMVKPFADGVRALDESNGGEGAGSMDMIVSEYGLHIIFHDGNVTNLVEQNNIDNISDEDLLRILCTTMTRPDSNKSIFNYIYDTLKLDENLYNNHTQQIIKTLRTNLKNNGIEIVYYEDAYKDLYE